MADRRFEQVKAPKVQRATSNYSKQTVEEEMRFWEKKGQKVNIDYGFSCGRHWISINDKVIAQTPGDDFCMPDEEIRKLAIAVIPNCVWKTTNKEGDKNA